MSVPRRKLLKTLPIALPAAWPGKAEKVAWKLSFNKPLIMSEFGGEALNKNHSSADTASFRNEEYQEQLDKN